MIPVYIRPWRSWITQRIPIPENRGSNPFGRAILGEQFWYNVLKLLTLVFMRFFEGWHSLPRYK